MHSHEKICQSRLSSLLGGKPKRQDDTGGLTKYQLECMLQPHCKFPSISAHITSKQFPRQSHPYLVANSTGGETKAMRRLGAAEQMHSHVVAIEGTIKWCGFTEVPQMIPFAWAVILTQNVEGNSTVEAIMLPPLITEILSEMKCESHLADEGEEVPKTSDDFFLQHTLSPALIPFVDQSIYRSPILPLIFKGAMERKLDSFI